MSREKSKHAFWQTQSPRTGSEHPIRGSYQRKGPAIGKAIRFKNIQRRIRERGVNPLTKESIFQHRGPCLLQRKSPSEARHPLLRQRWQPPPGRRDYPVALRPGIYRASEKRGPRVGSWPIRECPRSLTPGCERQEAIILKARPASPASSGARAVGFHGHHRRRAPAAQPLRPERKAMPPHGCDLCVDVY